MKIAVLGGDGFVGWPTVLHLSELGHEIAPKEVAQKYAHRIDRSRIPAVSAWTKKIAGTIDHDPERKKLRLVTKE